ncbi:MAG: glycosyltransferase family 87 protein [Candidatus Dormibacteria bacterium]
MPLITERSRHLLRLAAVCLLLGDLAAQAARGVWNMAAGASVTVDWIPFAAAARLLSRGSSCLYCGAPLAASEAAYLGHALPTSVGNPAVLDMLPSGVAYAAFLNPPPAAAVLVPLAVLPPALGFLIFTVISVAALAVAYLVLVTRLDCPRFPTLCAVAAVPGVLGLALGQWDALLALALVGGLWAAPRRPWVAGLLLSVLVVKPQSLWLVPVGLLIIREYRVLLGLLLGGLLWVAASVALVGSSQSGAWLGAVIGAGSKHIAISFGLPGLVGVAAGAGAGYVAFGVAGVLLIATGLWFRVRLRANPELAIALFVCLSLVFSPHVLAPDFVLTAPALALAARWRPGPSLAAAAVLSIAFLPDLNLSSPNALLGFVAIAAATLAAVVALGGRNATPNPPTSVPATLGAAP